jgi:hypothetical protein
MSIFVVNLAKTTLVFAAFVALASGAYASTISSYSISTTSADGTPCSISGSGPGSASCFSETPGSSFHFPSDAGASVTLTDDSIQLMVGSFHASNAQAFASITHDDFYSVPVNGPVSALERLTCNLGGSSVGALGHFSLGSTNVSPPVETIYTGASQGSGPCGPNQIAGAPIFVVSLVAANNIVHLQTNIDASGSVGDFSGQIIVRLTVNGFQDANGNPITATLLPEPGTLGTFGLALLVGVATKASRKLLGLSGHN